jgi:CheY-like chemotaxis protein
MSPFRSASMFGSNNGPSNGCVLVVENEPKVRRAMCEALTQAGYDVIEAGDANTGIETIKTGENPLVVDAVITDIDMDKGMEAATYFRTQYPHVPLVVVTGMPDGHAENQKRTKVAILGAGKGGSALLDMFSHLAEVEIVGIADKNPAAPGLKRARELNIPVVNDTASLIAREGIHLIVDVTGDPRMDQVMAAHKRAEAEVLGGAAAKLLWTLVQHEAQMQRQVLQSEKVAGMIKEGVADYLLKPIAREKLLLAVGQAMERREISRL